MSKISIIGNVEYPKEQIIQLIIDLVKDRLFIIKDEIKTIKIDLNHFKNKYNLSNEKFQEKYSNENLGDEYYYFIWESLIKILEIVINQIQLLRSI